MRYFLDAIIVDDIRLNCAIRECVSLLFTCSARACNQRGVQFSKRPLSVRATVEGVAGGVHLRFGYPTQDNACICARRMEVRQDNRQRPATPVPRCPDVCLPAIIGSDSELDSIRAHPTCRRRAIQRRAGFILTEQRHPGPIRRFTDWPFPCRCIFRPCIAIQVAYLVNQCPLCIEYLHGETGRVQHIVPTLTLVERIWMLKIEIVKPAVWEMPRSLAAPCHEQDCLIRQHSERIQPDDIVPMPARVCACQIFHFQPPTRQIHRGSWRRVIEFKPLRHRATARFRRQHQLAETDETPGCLPSNSRVGIPRGAETGSRFGPPLIPQSGVIPTHMPGLGEIPAFVHGNALPRFASCQWRCRGWREGVFEGPHLRIVVKGREDAEIIAGDILYRFRCAVFIHRAAQQEQIPRLRQFQISGDEIAVPRAFFAHTGFNVEPTSQICLTRVCVNNQQHRPGRQRVVRKGDDVNILIGIVPSRRNDAYLPSGERHVCIADVFHLQPVVSIVIGVPKFVKDESLESNSGGLRRTG